MIEVNRKESNEGNGTCDEYCASSERFQIWVQLIDIESRLEVCILVGLLIESSSFNASKYRVFK